MKNFKSQNSSVQVFYRLRGPIPNELHHYDNNSSPTKILKENGNESPEKYQSPVFMYSFIGNKDSEPNKLLYFEPPFVGTNTSELIREEHDFEALQSNNQITSKVFQCDKMFPPDSQ